MYFIKRHLVVTSEALGHGGQVYLHIGLNVRLNR